MFRFHLVALTVRERQGVKMHIRRGVAQIAWQSVGQ
jgi:hypothetical protein